MSTSLAAAGAPPANRVVASRALPPSRWMVFGFLGAVTFCGILFGAVLSRQLDTTTGQAMHQAITQLLSATGANAALTTNSVFLGFAMSDLQLLALIWLFGVSVIGFPLVVVAMFLRGLGIGFAVGITAGQFGWSGLLASMFSTLVHQSCSLCVLLYSGCLAIRLTNQILYEASHPAVLLRRIAGYTGVFAVCGMILVVMAFVEAEVAPGWLMLLSHGGT